MQKELKPIITTLNRTIFTPDLQDILEVTYAYKHTEGDYYFNNTLFTKFAGCTQRNSFDVIEKAVKNKADDKLNKIHETFDILDLLPDSPRLKVLKGSLRYAHRILRIVRLALPFELEKAGKTLDLSDEEILTRTKEIERLEGKIFGGNIRDNPLEIQQCYVSLKRKMLKHKNDFTENEMKYYKFILSKVKELLTHYDLDVFYNEYNKKIDAEEILIEKDLPILKKKLTRRQYSEIFSLVFEIYGIHIPVVFDERSSIYDGQEALYIPINKTFDTITVNRVLELVVHEIESHYIVAQNNNHILGNFRGAGSIEKEEGLAMVAEEIFRRKKIEKIGIVHTFPMILLGEILDGYELVKYLKLRQKTSGDFTNFTLRLLRLKRNYPLHHRGVQHKDSGYSRGIRKVVNYLQNDNALKDLYLGKVGFDDLKHAKKIQSDHDIKLVYPINSAELVIQILRGKELCLDYFEKYIEITLNNLKVDKDQMQPVSLDLLYSNISRIVNIIKS